MSEDQPLTPEQIEAIRRYCTGFPEQNEDGVDLSLIRGNLRMSPQERLRRAYRGRYQAMRLMEYGQRHGKNALRENR